MMNEIKCRLAKPSDANQIADCHWHVRDRYTKGIFLSLGKSFLVEYYKIILDDPWEVIVCAVKNDGKIVGFKSTTLNAASQAQNLRKHRIRLGFAALKSLLLKPTLIKAVWQRYQSLKGNGESLEFVHTEGVRGEYWCWLPEEDGSYTIELNKADSQILRGLGVKEIFFEVDKFNKKVYNYHLKVTKGEPIEEIVLPDGRVRVLFKKTLK